jgi:zinc/manganese transport system substrate-binding protein
MARAGTGWLAAGIAVALAAPLAACGSGASPSDGRVQVVAAESPWGAIARELAGQTARVRSVIVDPNQDPHDYEPTPADARAFATARLAIVNGIGYDGWASRLLATGAVGERRVLDVGDLLGLRAGDNPHRWYAPADVEKVADAIGADLARLDPAHAADFARRRRAFETQGLAAYHRAIARIRARYAGVPVGASESVFALLAPALGLRLITPPSFMKAVGEGIDVSAADTATVQRQLSRRELAVWVSNPQNATPAVQRLDALARARGIPVVSATETLTPPGASFQRWQVRQLDDLERALARASGR